jgi:hypothetical protein
MRLSVGALKDANYSSSKVLPNLIACRNAAAVTTGLDGVSSTSYLTKQ